MWALSFDESGATGNETLIPNSGHNIVAIGVDQNHELYFADYNGGRIHRLAHPAEAGDLTGDGRIDVADLLELLNQWGRCGGDGCAADFNRDGSVGVGDLLTLLAAWG